MAKLFCVVHKFTRKKTTDFLPYNKCLDLFNGEDKVYRKTHKIMEEKDYYKMIRNFSNDQL